MPSPTKSPTSLHSFIQRFLRKFSYSARPEPPKRIQKYRLKTDPTVGDYGLSSSQYSSGGAYGSIRQGSYTFPRWDEVSNRVGDILVGLSGACTRPHSDAYLLPL